MSKFLRFFTLLFFCLVYVYVHSLPINQGCTINKASSSKYEKYIKNNTKCSISVAMNIICVLFFNLGIQYIFLY